MNVFKYLLLISFITTSAFAQVVKKDSIKTEEISEENDTILGEAVLLEEVIISKDKLDAEGKKQFLLLQNRVYKVYPYAKIASERLTSLNKNMANLKTNREKKKYFKIVEDYIENEFTAKLKKLSRKQGQILVKLIYRQTGITTYDLIKEYKSGWKAFWSNNTAKLFDINIKSKYDPYQVNEDYLIETILERAFNSGRLVKQESANPIDYYDLSDHWYKKASKK
ncbi:DUF4294 domain-containing protein [Flavobacterium sp.]|uniref:DUF4294 domain-containing protein n=1 Tax=Flavobacterium sp. TaxID=239 RepID=UPI002B4B1A40|nr:DUF4294 domain-containing protein [Flavobacterium sp.]HLF52984.1 DUF4294 domain-containing protein [Flavobacterium sp.]